MCLRCGAVGVDTVLGLCVAFSVAVLSGDCAPAVEAGTVEWRGAEVLLCEKPESASAG